MKSVSYRVLCAALMSLFAVAASPAHGAATSPTEGWFGTWAASPEAQLNTTAWSGNSGMTYREVVHTSAGGAAVRIVVTNEFGLDPLTVGAARIAIPKGQSSIQIETAKSITFGGQSSVTLPVGTLAVSDPIDMQLPPFSDVAISLFIPAQQMSRITLHSYALQTNYQVPGNVVDAETLPMPLEIQSWHFLKCIQVKVDALNGGDIVALGDSITDGAASKPDTNGRWPDVLANRVQADKSLSGMGVLNAGINGNRLLRDGDGESALRRLDRDVLAQAGVKYLVVLEGINDIGHLVTASPSDPAATSQDLIHALEQIVMRAHAHGIKVIGATMTPYESCKYASPEGEKIREAVNDWIRSSKQLDGFADFDKTVRDPAHPTRFLPAYDSGDHLHPNTAGLRAMADSIDLNFFRS